jgi:hypothetical protein
MMRFLVIKLIILTVSRPSKLEGFHSLRCRAFDFFHFAPQFASGTIRSGK